MALTVALLVGGGLGLVAARDTIHDWSAASYPPLPADAAARPLAVAPQPVGRGDYDFLMRHADGRPVTWDPCRPIHVVVAARGAPDNGEALVRSALSAVGAAAGLVFVIDGDTAERPNLSRDLVQPDGYGDRWAPVLVAWSDPIEYPPLAGDVVGVAGPVAIDPPGTAGPRFVTGTVVLEAEWFATVGATAIGRRQAGAVLRHELGHLMGLDHVDDPLQLMSPVYQSIFDYSAGDRQGLAALGGGPCVRDT